MARIRTAQRAATTHVHIVGKLTAADVGRLEHACRRALTTRPVQLQFELGRVTLIDATAAAFLARLERHGATIRRSKVTNAD